MIRIELQPAEAEVLATALESYLSDLRMEIADTDSMDFREGLKARKKTLRKIVTMIDGALGRVEA